jgi:hypothetical protein
MKRIAGALLVAAFAVWVAADVVHEFRANETADYYSSRPERLWYVLAITGVGAAVAVGFYRSSPRAQRGARQFSLWTLLLVTTAIAFMLALIRIITM